MSIRSMKIMSLYNTLIVKYIIVKKQSWRSKLSLYNILIIKYIIVMNRNIVAILLFI